ncbi:MAG: T9SS type A sorting domain-containing protein [Bacteroidales bacterium]|nr:T9SS type A sorting domain-containing protein [Bacteroidales bacterium]MCF8344940.1 T9SS type A sorting domain-containing protein [Bacteroidales bacterium]MCF8351148.1 T9SS type A sorting domain-containing protein [Bacteroidales bacterium]MCF8376613.1 T9SS type A sorting domain-containing protein [Bacteroidales bacterium]MCF8400665.1 T9SS type A sorting domain-containing protein [Bacteroidales bacterium]
MKRTLSLISLILISTLMFAQERIYTPELVSPIDGVTFQDPGVTLDWNAVTGNTDDIRYEVRLDTDPAFPAPIIHEAGLVYSSYTCSELIFSTTYYWQVRATDGLETSAWSEIGVFTTTGFIFPRKPADFTDEADVKIELGWKEVLGTSSFEIQFDTMNDWIISEQNFGDDLYDVHVMEATHAWAVGESGMILFNDGTQWVEETSGISDDLYAVQFLSETAGWACGEGGIALNYDNGTWSTVEVLEEAGTPTTADLNSLFIINENLAYIGGEGGKIFKYDGALWMMMTDALEADVFGLFFLNENFGYAVCEDGFIYHFNGTDWTLDYEADKDMFAVSIISETQAWAVGQTGRIFVFNGTDWTRQQVVSRTPFNSTLEDIEMIDEETGYIATEEYVLTYQNGNWIPNNAGIKDEFYGLGFSDATTGYMVGKDGNIIEYTGNFFTSPNATTYTVTESNDSYTVEDLYFGTPYYWRVRAKVNGDFSDWSGIWSFKTFDIVELKRPTNNKIDVLLDATLEWNEYKGVNKYELWLADNPGFNNHRTVRSDSGKALVDLYYFDNEYFWKVKTYHELDTTDWSETWSFTSIATVPLRIPADGATEVSQKPLIRWDSLGGVSHYQLQFNDTENWDDPMGNMMFDSTRFKLQVSTPFEEGATIYWRVRALSTFNRDTSAWAEPFSFTVEGAIGIKDHSFAEMINLYPNPCHGIINLDINASVNDPVRIMVMDLLGQTFVDETFITKSGLNNKRINISDLSSGIYLIRLEKGEETYSQKIILDK